ncbi:MAG: glycosyltransferase family 4 protein [Lentimicrobium sp.]
MKILFLTRWYPPYNGNFVELHAKAVALNNELTVLAILPRENSPGFKPFVDGRNEKQRFTVVRYFYSPSRCRIAVMAGLINLVKFGFRSLAGYRYILKNYGSIDLIHVHILTRAAVPAFLINLIYGTPYIISEHWTRYIPENYGFTNIFRRALTRIIFRHAVAASTVSNYLKTAMEDCGLRNKNFIVIPNVVDTNLFKSAETQIIKQKIRILHVSTLQERSKNISGILRVIKILSEQRKDFKLLFIGGDESSQVEAGKYASGLGLESPVVIFGGSLPAEELSDVYRQSSFLLMFSNYESFSIVIPEAISCGIPVLATSVGGIPEYFRPEAGILGSPGNETELLENLNFMLDNFQRYNPKQLGSYIESRFGLKSVGSRFDELYRSVFKGRNNKSLN